MRASRSAFPGHLLLHGERVAVEWNSDRREEWRSPFLFAFGFPFCRLLSQRGPPSAPDSAPSVPPQLPLAREGRAAKSRFHCAERTGLLMFLSAA